MRRGLWSLTRSLPRLTSTSRHYSAHPKLKMEHYLADKNPPVCSLNVAQAWSALTSQESTSHASLSAS